MAYVVTRQPDNDTAHLGNPSKTAADVLKTVLASSGAEPSAHQARQDEHDRWLGLPQLVAEYRHLVKEARAEWEARPSAERAKLLTLRDATRGGMRGYRPPRIAGLIPELTFPISPQVQAALEVRKQAIEQRVNQLAKKALADKPAWLPDLGPQPKTQQGRARWHQALRTAIAYRDLHNVTGDRALGAKPSNPGSRISGDLRHRQFSSSLVLPGWPQNQEGQRRTIGHRLCLLESGPEGRGIPGM
jgi:hypothetical protein